ncbi:hypothetical protein CHS0354_018387 [Potamilus streckersoni]|uniref:Cytochrome c domain-containing protein n=1 Tax=Potamilus streckersoni TaxID=2493646 RepID=A0AAE0W991_9BIVA|nr:hypothetical protein CHS0354_018387 [Potamilus streckersoni]
METPFQWQQLLYAAYVTLLTVVLFVYLYHLYGSKERSRGLSGGHSQSALLMFFVLLAVVAGLLIYVFKKMKGKELPPGEIDMGKDFDGIREQNNPTPYGLHIIMGCIVSFGFWYVVFGYPISNWSHEDFYQNDSEKHRRRFDKVWTNIRDEDLTAMGESVFNTQCVICHGITGEGMNGRAANLRQFGTEEHIVYVLKNGSKGLRKLTPEMAPMYEVIEADPAKREEAAYNHSKATPEAGKGIYDAQCAVCHGPEGNGRGPDGSIENFAADLTAYGTPAYTEEIIRNGKKGHIGTMPVFTQLNLLSDIQYKHCFFSP